ncbi:hypothetical protein HNQ91_002467 [Filimonas zeae]|uniref:Nucleotidyltransferase DUF2204 n=1 Tax=Filimonas zeae TaxID=1737353 RepID=A0A917MVU2_9BACT|nr:nucleotidyltransferase [Filimonas zeae]MDR6339416.1 hypothetical protein [Filimonas zeae]GGH63689.1 hypothetical protein GCM10011379_14890 [Filimonas zeae]
MKNTTEEHTKARAVYYEALKLLLENEVPFMVGGGFAFFHYAGVFRDTKDLDIFCKPGEYAAICKLLEKHGYTVELTDARWLAKLYKGEYYIDIIFNSTNGICTVTDTWYAHAQQGSFDDLTVPIIPAEELIWGKIYVQNRERFDGADINHLMLRYGRQLDWKRLAGYFDQHWHLLLSQLLSFQFIYPADYADIIPRWLFDELIQRAQQQYDMPASQNKVCLGPLIDQTQYQTDIKDWDYKVTTLNTV